MVTRVDDGHVKIGTVVIELGPPSAGSVRVGSPAKTAWTAQAGDTRWVFLDGEVYTFEVARGSTRRRRSSGGHDTLTAPMPATVRRIQTAVGQAARRGDILVVLEAMKMELPVRAPADGTVSAVHCREGDLVQPGHTLVEFDEADESSDR